MEKGFLVRRGDGGRCMTDAQANFALRAVEAAIEDRRGREAPDVLALAMRVTKDALDHYPRDQSCRTCDFFGGDGRESSGHCAHWKADVPPHAVDDGCANHQAHGAPF